MSQLGQSRPNRAVRIMSGLSPIATVEQTSPFGSFVPSPDSCIAANRVLFDDLVGPLQRSWALGAASWQA